MENYSVLTTLYIMDNTNFLKQSIDSMLKQTTLTNDYVIVADGPLSETQELALADYSTKYGFFNIVRLPDNCGLGAALREGLRYCKNELVARLDADDISMPERCELQIAEFEKDSRLCLVGSDMYEFSDNPEIILTEKRMPSTSEQIYKYAKHRNPFNHSSVMYKKSVIEANGNYSTMRRSQDLELWTRLLCAGCKCMNINKPLIKFRCGDTRVKRKRKWSNVKSDLSVFYRSYEMGYTTFYDFLYVLVTQMAFFIMPIKVAGWLYTKLFRKNIKNKLVREGRL